MERKPRWTRLPPVVFFLVFAAAPGLARAGITLKKVHFPAALDGAGGTTVPPGTVPPGSPLGTPATAPAPLSQAIAFEFDGVPSVPIGIVDGVRIRVAGDNSNTAGQTPGDLAYGTYKVDGKVLLFQPRLPTAPLPSGFGPPSPVASDASLPGLLPDTWYTISVSIGTPNSVANLTKIAAPLPLKFKTVATTSGPLAVATYFSNAPAVAPKPKPAQSKPANGAAGVAPNAFNDPAGLFASIPAGLRPPFTVRFKGPLNPASENVSGDRLRLRAVFDASGATEDVPLAVDLSLVKNKISHSDVLVFPRGVLPLGHVIAVESSSKLESLAGVAADPGPSPPSWKEVVRYRVAVDPTPAQPIDDFVLEDFDTTDHADVTIAAGGESPAAWDAVGSNVLRASFGFAGDGSLGRFAPPVDVHTINLDTDFQAFPLFDGATPDVLPGAAVKGGVFNFTDFHLPANVTLVIRGTNPAVITCTGECVIEGQIDLNGAQGTEDDTFDSAIVAAPGGSAGPGGGRGGDGHPVVAPGGGQSIQFMQTPQFGQSGFAPGNTGPGGGGGGQCGCTYPWAPFAGDPFCTNFTGVGDGSRGSGGGGGSFVPFLPDPNAQSQGVAEDPSVPVSGRRGAVGIGNHLPVTFNPGAPIPNEPQAYDGVTANCVARPNPNPTFHQAYDQGLIYDKLPALGMSSAPTAWVNTHAVTFGGAAGPAVFRDASADNDYIFGGGELTKLIGGEGGGGGGSRTEGLSQICKQQIFINQKLPFTVLDAKGGGGGGAGGALMIQALGTIVLEGPKCRIRARGAQGGSSEDIGTSARGGAAGAGSGGAVLLMSATNVDVNDPTLASSYTADKSVGGHVVAIDVSGGPGKDAAILSNSTASGTSGGDAAVLQVGDGAPGGPGIVQIQVPAGAPDHVDAAFINARINRSVLNIAATNAAQSDFAPLVDRAKTPSPLTSISVARSTWYDLGAVTEPLRPRIATSAGLLAGPVFGVPGQGPFFTGTDANGFVATDAAGNVVSPVDNDFEVDSPDQAVAKADFVPKGPLYFQSVQIRFQGADDDVSNPGNPDLATATPFSGDATALNGKRFVRFEVKFDIATNPSQLPSQSTPRPQLNFLRLPFKY